jgi:uncharacterized protein YjbJ (UPF0337 family)
LQRRSWAPNLHCRLSVSKQGARGIRFERAFQTHQRLKERTMGEIIDKAKGKIKQAAGIVAGDKKLEQEGKIDEAKGKVKGAVEDIKHAVRK